MPANALVMQLCSDGYVIRYRRIRSLERSEHSAEHRSALEIRFRELPCPPAQFKPHRPVVRKLADCESKSRAVFRCHHQAALGDDFTDFRTLAASRDDGATAGEHPR